CEGYIESAAIGLLAARFWIEDLRGSPPSLPPAETALGALLGHITGGADADTFQPMNVNFGLFPPLSGVNRKADRKQMYTDRARLAFGAWQGLEAPQPSAASTSAALAG
ncbi:MAG: FADH(2)-oxidizing methylenetetrahydrofolate--tRNA-(uracil(54)-C(5))-methyltransferase TrmFO, partial [Sphingomonadaceae bacterium]|nr:FADH(2)-oxidizing methylenetetrahydrofolate--tRNA-(uracil(54)-C(5))-methyltransferase TrmFO [Sphingomonadaceae bacterium]